MSEFNFKSQICTSKVQSERLLALGLKKETADMCWQALDGEPITYPYVWMNSSIITNNHFPAWSLHRLIELQLNSTDTRFEIRFNQLDLKDAYDFSVGHIEHLIKEGYFNKEYLEE
jgi:hypothetical protein